MGILYRITFPSGKSYIGITTKSLRRRLTLHRYHAKSGRCHPVHGAIRKYGLEAAIIDILVVANDKKYLCDLEIKAIAAFDTLTPNGYNLSPGGECPNGYIWSEEQRKKMSESRKGMRKGLPGNPGWKHTEEAKKKISLSGVGRIFTEECKRKIGNSKIGNKYNVGRIVSQETREKISAAHKGRATSAETRTKISQAFKGKPWSPARRLAHEKRYGNEKSVAGSN